MLIFSAAEKRSGLLSWQQQQQQQQQKSQAPEQGGGRSLSNSFAAWQLNCQCGK
jgi:hypothetical protein